MDSNKAHYVVATGILIKDGKYLIAKRSEKEKAFPGKWTVPGGKPEVTDYKDRPADTNAGQWYNIGEDIVKREMKEEVDLSIQNIRYLASLVFIRPDGIPTLVLSYAGDYVDGEVTLCPDLTDYKWVTLEEKKSYDLIDGIWEEIEMLERSLKGKEIGIWQKKQSKNI